MITDTFINSCFSVIFCKSNIKKNKTLYRNIIEILDLKNKNDVPVSMKNRIEILDNICKMLLIDKSLDSIIDSLSFSDKYKQIIPILESKLNENLSDNAVLDHVNQVKLRKKLNSLLTNQARISKIINSVQESSFDSIDDLICDYEDTIKLLYVDMMNSNRSAGIESISSIDLRKDDYTPILSKIIEKYDEVNTTPTGYELLDTQIFYGGFEKSRLYIFAGAAGSGKSTLLCNLMLNSIKKQSTDITRSKVYIYITLENMIDESFVRIYQAMFDKTKIEVLNDINHGIDIKDQIVSELEKTNSTIIMKYFSPGTISVTDIMMVLDDIAEEYSKENILGLYLDYLDVLRNDIKSDRPDLEIGHIALSLKALAVDYSIPLITVTHLNMTSYGQDAVKNLNIGQMSKSVQKIEHSDFVCLMVRDPMDDTIIHMKIGKNRSGQANNISIDFKVDLNKSKFVDCFWPNKSNQNFTNDSFNTYGGNNLF